MGGKGGDTPINTEFKKEYFIKRTIYKLHALHLINFQKKINESRFEALKVVQKRSNFLLR